LPAWQQLEIIHDNREGRTMADERTELPQDRVGSRYEQNEAH